MPSHGARSSARCTPNTSPITPRCLHLRSALTRLSMRRAWNGNWRSKLQACALPKPAVRRRTCRRRRQRRRTRRRRQRRSHQRHHLYHHRLRRSRLRPRPSLSCSGSAVPRRTRGNLTLAELSTFWGLLRGLFVRRETRELQAAQLLALGVRMSDDNKRKMRILEALGMIQLQVSVACPKMSPRAPPVRTHTR
jgi:hypothetical protein